MVLDFLLHSISYMQKKEDKAIVNAIYDLADRWRQILHTGNSIVPHQLFFIRDAVFKLAFLRQNHNTVVLNSVDLTEIHQPRLI